MTDYVLGTMTMSGPIIDLYDSSEFSTIPTGTTVTMVASFSSIGSRFSFIRNAFPNGLLSGWYFYAQGPGSQQVQLVLNSITWGSTSASLSVTVNGVYDDLTFKSVVLFQATFLGSFTAFNVTYAQIAFGPLFSTPNTTAQGLTVANIFFSYLPDSGPFNVEKLVGPISRQVAKAEYPAGSEMYEWNFYLTNGPNPNVTPDEPQASSSYDLAPGESATVFAWYRLRAEWGGTGTWLPFASPPGPLPTPVTYQNGL
jgi:hypothetical protein